jgi:predicted Na+-dependent transporter
MDADHALTVLFNAGIAISVGATVASLGMTYGVAELLAPLRRVGLVITLVAVNAIAIPAVAWGLAKASPISSSYVPGLVLATLGMGSAASLKAGQLSKRADLALGVSVVVVLQLVNIVAVPLWAGRVVSGASISTWDIVKSLLALVLAPLVIGLLVKARYADHSADWQPALVRIANIALVIALATGIAANWETIVSMVTSWVIVTALVIIALALAVGALVGGRNIETRTTTTLVTGIRFGSLGLIIIGTQLDGNATYMGPAITFTLLDFVLPVLLAVEIGRKVRPVTVAIPREQPHQ